MKAQVLATDFRFILFMQLTVTVAVVECGKQKYVILSCYI